MSAEKETHDYKMLDLASFDPLATSTDSQHVDYKDLDDFFALNLENNGIKLSDLNLSAEGDGHVEFETKSKQIESSSEDEGNCSFDEDEKQTEVQDEISIKSRPMLQVPKQGELIPTFTELVKRMYPIREDGKIMKRIMVEGFGEMVTDDAFVSFHYNAYRDNEDECFDSTYMRRNPWKVCISEGGVLPGLKGALMSMKKNEKSQFLLHPDLMYGANGCPPRIPKGATLLYEITVVDVVEGEVASLMENQNQSTADLKVLLKAVDREHAEGVEYFKNQSFKFAVGCFKRAVRKLENFSKIRSKEDSEEQMKKLLTLYLNLAVCHNSLDEPERACVMCQEALKIDPGNCKANFHYGRALLSLGDYQEAKIKLMKAKCKNPTDRVINFELMKVQEKKAKSEQKEKDIAKHILQCSFVGGPKPNSSENSSQLDKKPDSDCTDLDINEPFRQSMNLRLDRFIANKKAKKIDLPLNLNESELTILRNLAQEKELSFTITGPRNYTIAKLE